MAQITPTFLSLMTAPWLFLPSSPPAFIKPHAAKKLWFFKLLPHAEKIQFTYVESPVEKVIPPFTERKTDTITAFASITH